MHKIKLAVCIQDAEYKKRFVNCLMNHYRNQLELHIFTGTEELLQAERGTFHAILLSGNTIAEQEFKGIPKFYLTEEEHPQEESTEEGVWYVDKYQEVSKIVEEALKHIGSEICQLQKDGQITEGTRFTGIYSLSESEYQLPYAVTYGSILSEREPALLIDLQENSGFSQMKEQEHTMGLEELLIMAENGKYSKAKLISCIGHMGHVDMVYPAVNTECLCEADARTYRQLIQILTQELEYKFIIINFGSRFSGFFELLSECGQLYFLQKKGGPCQWREEEFLHELEAKGCQELIERIIKVEIPLLPAPVTSFERLIEQWKWNEFGDLIRKGMPGVIGVG